MSMSDSEDDNASNSIVNNVTPSCFIYEYVRYAVKGANDYLNVSYIQNNSSSSSSSGRTHCGLCQKDIFDGPWKAEEAQREALEKHVHTLRHETRFLQLKHLQKRHVKFLRSKRLQKSGKLRKRLSRLGLTKWKWHVNHLVMEYIDAPLPDKPTTVPTPEEHRWSSAAMQLAQYEQMERLSLLELAIMKRMKQHPKEACATATKDESAMKNGASIIIPLVMEFLGQPMPLPFLSLLPR